MTVDPESTAVVVVDMQNDLGSPGGMYSRAGIPIDGIRAVVTPTARVIAASRQVGMPIIYLVMQFEADLSDAGSAETPNRIKHAALGIGDTIEAPDGAKSQVLVRGTWNTRIVDDLKPEPGDHIMPKHRYSGFYATDLDELLRDLGIDTLIVTGCTTSVCVDSTVRDAFYRDYRCLVLEDCVAEPLGSASGRSNHEASLLTIEALFGWVASSAAFLNALPPAAGSNQY
jgi:ureidoacrylate peracid hydrolase